MGDPLERLMNPSPCSIPAARPRRVARLERGLGVEGINLEPHWGPGLPSSWDHDLRQEGW